MQRCLGCMREFDKAIDVCPHCGYVVGSDAASKNHLAPGTLLQGGHYTLGKALGQGGFGITYIAWDIVLTMKVAVKEYFPENNAVRNTEKNGEYLTEIKLASGGDSDAYAKGLNEFLREARTLSKCASLEGVVTVRDFCAC